VIAVLGVIKPCTCSYTRTLRFLIPRSCAYLDSLGKFGLRVKSGFKNKCWARARFGLVISGSRPGLDFKMRPIYDFVLANKLLLLLSHQQIIHAGDWSAATWST